MIAYRSSVEIGRSADAVFEYLVDPKLQALWSNVPMRPLTPGRLATGSRMEVTFGSGQLGATLGLEVIDLVPSRRLGFRTFSGPIAWEGSYALEASGADRTIVTQEGQLELSGTWRLFEPAVGAEIKRGEVKELERLKAAVEASDQPGE